MSDDGRSATSESPGDLESSENRLAEGEAFLQSVFDAIQDGVSVLDADLRIVRVNRWMQEMYAHAAPLEGRKCFEVYHGRDAICDVCPTVAAIESGEHETRLVRYVSAEGPRGWLDLTAFPIKDEQGRVVRIIEYVKDVTDQKRAEQHLELQLAIALDLGSKADLEGALGSLAKRIADVDAVDVVTIFLLDEEGEELLLQAHHGMSGEFLENAQSIPRASLARRVLDSTEPLYTNLAELGDVPPHEQAVNDAALAQGFRSTAVLPLRFRDQALGTINVASKSVDSFIEGTRLLLQSIAAEAGGAVARIRFEEERLALESRIQQAQKLESLGVLAGGIAHDFNNLLVGILGNADLALMDLPPESPARQYIQDVEVASRRAAELVRQMLAYSGKGRFVVERLDLGVVVEEMVHLLEASITKKALLRFDLPKQLPAVEADATQLRQVVMNLITNASDAIGERSGVISVRTGVMDCDASYLEGSRVAGECVEGSYVYVEVSDTGVGMDDATLAKIFDPFFTTKFTGRGLGLAAVLGIVRSHDGAIKVYSERGKGASFKVLLPALELDEKFASSTSTSPGPPPQEGGTVLLVDDEETVRVVGRSMLERLGFEVVTAEDGRRALEIFGEEPGRFACVLLDLTMPHVDGEECFRELRRMDPDIAVILSSGYTEQELIARFAGKGLAGFVQKPYRLRDLAEALGAALG